MEVITPSHNKTRRFTYDAEEMRRHHFKAQLVFPVGIHA
jgi:hypothetical protein